MHGNLLRIKNLQFQVQFVEFGFHNQYLILLINEN